MTSYQRPDLFVFGNRERPRDPRILGYNWQPIKPGQQADFLLDADGYVVPIERLQPETFITLFRQLPWEYGGKKK